jgi:hypothetical protein
VVAEHADVVTLRRLPAHAAAMLTDLAETEQDIAATLTSQASRNGSPLATQRQQLAEAAASGARRARERAQELRQLATTSAAKERPL